jgi:predicted Zn-dependent protease with MMP-like domain
MVLPDKITIFQKPIEETCRNRAQVKQMVKDVVRHEVAHYFGFSDADLPF